MVNSAEETARSAEQSNSNEPGYCLQWSRERADISAMYSDASTAWRNTNDRHPGDRKPPRGSMVYWTGGSHGYGHIAPSLGGGKVRSSDAGGAGRPATVDLGWVESHWGLPYAGWAWDVNEVTIPHDDAHWEDGPEMNKDDWTKMQSMLDETVKKVWDLKIEVEKKDGTKEPKRASQIIKETWQKVARAT